MASNPALSVRVYAVWMPILATDFARPSTAVMSRLPDLRVQQFWDPDSLVAKAIAGAAQPQPEPDCCEQDGILWDLAAVYARSARWDDRLPGAIFLNGPVIDVRDGIDTALKSVSR